MTSSHLSRSSAALQLVCGLALLFGSDNILPWLIPTLSTHDAWLGQLLAAALLALAALNWLSRTAVLGGIYGRPIVAANATFFFVASTSLGPLAIAGRLALVLTIFTGAIFLFAAVYAWLLYRGPFPRDFESAREAK